MYSAGFRILMYEFWINGNYGKLRPGSNQNIVFSFGLSRKGLKSVLGMLSVSLLGRFQLISVSEGGILFSLKIVSFYMI